MAGCPPIALELAAALAAGASVPGEPAQPGALVALAALVLIAVLAAVLVTVVRRRRSRRARPARRPEPKPHYPVVLAHGLFGFDEIVIGNRRHDYFRGVPSRLERSGHEVHRPRVARAAPVAVRAQELAEWIRALPASKVNVVAHSMGGLDARYAISRLGLADRVASLTTIGAPHLGTPIADLGAQLGDRFGLRRALEAVGVDVSALLDLTAARMEAFNREVPDADGVAYASVVAVARRKRDMNPLLVPAYLYLRERSGENDGMVPAYSQRWGEVVAEIEADHWAQIGWSRRFDAAEFYASLLRELRGRGF